MTAVRRRTDPPAAHTGVLAVTMGDAAGIGPDITLMSWMARERLSLPPFAVYGTCEALRERARALGLDVALAAIGAPGDAAAAFARALPVIEMPGGAAGDPIVAGIEAATLAVLAGEALALVTNPIAKKTLSFAHLPYPGHTEFLADVVARRLGGPRPRPVMMMVAEELKVVPATVHVPLAAVPALLTRTLLVETLRITAAALAGDFGIARPRIAVCGLNPHAGEQGLIGEEEAALIGPVIAELAGEGLAVTGPYSADSLFHAGMRASYDAVVAMYHDQALVPFKTLAFDRGVNVTLGLPIVRTSPDHGTAQDIAGTGKAKPTSFVAALRLAAELGRRRAAQNSAVAP